MFPSSESYLLWCGLASASDQLLAMKHLRKDMNYCLKRIGFELQLQAYDHVLKEEKLERDAIHGLIEYIARNAERSGLVAVDAFASYNYTSCLIPGYPQIRLFQADGFDRIWRTLFFLKRTECFRLADPKYSDPS